MVSSGGTAERELLLRLMVDSASARAELQSYNTAAQQTVTGNTQVATTAEHAGTGFGSLRAEAMEARGVVSGLGLDSQVASVGIGALSAASLEATSGIIALGIAVVGATAFVVAEGSAFEDAQAKLQAWGDMSLSQASDVSAAFLAQAGTTTMSVQQEVEALATVVPQLELINGAQLTVAQSTQFMAAATDLAEASGQKLGATTTALASIQVTFGHSTTEAAADAGTLLAVTELTGVGVDNLAMVIGRLHDRFGPLAPDLEQTGVLLLQLEEAGVTGQRGLMVVSSAIDHLLADGPKTSEELTKLGVSLYNADGSAKPLEATLGALSTALSGMSDKQRIAAENMLFGASGGAALDTVLKNYKSTLPDATAKVEELSNAHQQAHDRTDTFSGALGRLKAGAQSWAGALGDTIMGVQTYTDKLDLLARAALTNVDNHAALASGASTMALSVANATLYVDAEAVAHRGLVGAITDAIAAHDKSVTAANAAIESGGKLASTMHDEANETNGAAAAVLHLGDAAVITGGKIDLLKKPLGEAKDQAGFLSGAFNAIATAVNNATTIIDKGDSVIEASANKITELTQKKADAIAKGETDVAAALQNEIVAYQSGDKAAQSSAAVAVTVAEDKQTQIDKEAKAEEALAAKVEGYRHSSAMAGIENKQFEAQGYLDAIELEKNGDAAGAKAAIDAGQEKQRASDDQAKAADKAAKEIEQAQTAEANAVRKASTDEREQLNQLIGFYRTMATDIPAQYSTMLKQNETLVQASYAKIVADDAGLTASLSTEQRKQLEDKRTTDEAELADVKATYDAEAKAAQDMGAAIDAQQQSDAAHRLSMLRDEYNAENTVALEVHKQGLDAQQAQVEAAQNNEKEIRAAGQRAILAADEQVQKAEMALDDAKTKLRIDLDAAEIQAAQVSAKSRITDEQAVSDAGTATATNTIKGVGDTIQAEGQLASTLTGVVVPAFIAADKAAVQEAQDAVRSANQAKEAVQAQATAADNAAAAAVQAAQDQGAVTAGLQASQATLQNIVPLASTITTSQDQAVTSTEAWVQSLQNADNALRSTNTQLSLSLAYTQDILAASGMSTQTDKALLTLQVQRDQLAIEGQSTAEIDKQIAAEQARLQLANDQNALDNVGLQVTIATVKAASDLAQSQLNIATAQQTATTNALNWDGVLKLANSDLVNANDNIKKMIDSTDMLNKDLQSTVSLSNGAASALASLFAGGGASGGSPLTNLTGGGGGVGTGGFMSIGSGNSSSPLKLAGGGEITEPIFGVGQSGQTYSFGESGPEYIMPAGGGGGFGGSSPIVNIYLNIQGGVYGDMAAAASQLSQAMVPELLSVLKR